MNAPKCMAAGLLAAGLLGLATLTSQAQSSAPAAPAAAKPQPDLAVMLKQVLDNQRTLETKVAEIQRRLDSISQFLGDQRASSYDTVDRRLRDIASDIEDIKR